MFDAAQTIINSNPTLTHLSVDVLLTSFCPEGFVGIGVPIGTDEFVRNFVARTGLQDMRRVAELQHTSIITGLRALAVEDGR